MKIKIKHPILLGAAVILYFALSAIIWGCNDTDSFLYDLINKRAVSDIVFFACMGLGLLGIESQTDHPMTPKIIAIVFFLMAIGNVRDKDYVFRNEKGEVDMGTKKVLPITLMFDHRLGGFADLAPFIKRINEIFANPEIIREW